jgi:transcriptional regulator with XRE-family HTH domain
MKTTQLFRNKIGFSQDAMAQHLLLTRSQLSMYEIGKRELPTHALLKLAEIEIFFNQVQKQSVTEKELLEIQKIQKKQLLLDYEKEICFKLLKAQRALKKIQKKHEQNVALLQLVLYLKLPNHVLQQAVAGIESNGPVQQLQHELEIQSFMQQAAYIEALKKEDLES